MIKRLNTNRGLIKALVIFFLALLLLAYFGLNLRGIVASPTFQDNWQFIKNLALTIWENYLSGVFHWIFAQFVSILTHSTSTPTIDK